MVVAEFHVAVDPLEGGSREEAARDEVVALGREMWIIVGCGWTDVDIGWTQ
jgi:hypothetical protein